MELEFSVSAVFRVCVRGLLERVIREREYLERVLDFSEFNVYTAVYAWTLNLEFQLGFDNYLNVTAKLFFVRFS